MMNMTDAILTEKEQVKKLAQQLGNPYILPDFKLLVEKVEELYCERLYRVKTLHEICDHVCQFDVKPGDGDDEGEGEGGINTRGDIVSPYSMISALYLINPRRAMSIFIEFICSYESAEDVIRNHSKRLGIKVSDKAVPMVMSVSERLLKENNKAASDKKSKDSGVTLG
ncbi:hypothetical protein PsalN5692_02042 [Piscirickettsia salmonis]|uniref:hypothetical protein n=3 Tax=Piscirickettsia salmonis TaxID=1238 RepID=UPI001E384522|nr:hypothetical protein [Piscirickettsia salmonis]QGP50577.1 hypothetical protein PsalN5692_02042 [Piscirickettsia salmonis]QGP54216.1 hypothetical protein PsalSR1_01648 [Piscirickettsia salmonis]QGP59885.1 hypothetical protein PsalBI1_02482 [Piscirickettsia salmonis]QGP63793.1 hypothetical protein PsalMR5_01657 [Piscirickettsia salmonis]